MYIYTKYICAQQISCGFNFFIKFNFFFNYFHNSPGRMIFSKMIYCCDFEKCRTSPQFVENIKPTRMLSAYINIAKCLYIYIKYIPY